MADLHLLNWRVQVIRQWSPLYTLRLDRYDPEPVPPVSVEIYADFDNDQAARAFESRVRELLGEISPGAT